MVSRLNSSNFSSCAQWPQPPNTCSCALRISLSADERAVERVDPVLAAPDQQRVVAQPVRLAPEQPVLEVVRAA